MRAFPLVSLILLCAATASAQQLLRVPDRSPRELEAYAQRRIEVLGRAENGDWILWATEADADWIRARGTQVEVLPEEFLAKRELGPEMGQYHTVAEMQARIDQLVLDYPHILRQDSIGQSIEGRELRLLEVSDAPGVDEAEPEVLILGALHARELMAGEIPFRFAVYLVENYATDARVRAVVDERRIFIVPVMNPDGRVYVEANHEGSWGSWWRKNRRANSDGSFGVDLNRNFSYLWGHDDIGSQPLTQSDTYRGPQPFSEPETQRLRDFCGTRSFRLGLSYHSFGNLLLYPWGYRYGDCADHEAMAALGTELTDDNGYWAGNPKAGTIYRTNGGSDDWAYGDDTDKASFYLYTVEVGSVEEGGFAPAEELIQPFFDRLLNMNLETLEYADEPRRVLGPKPPQLSSALQWDSPSLAISWQPGEDLPANLPLNWEVEELRDLAHLDVDVVRSDALHWQGDGFVVSNTGLLGSLAHRAVGKNNELATLTAKLPYRVSADRGIFSCRLRHEIELGFDYLYFQISPDGVSWTNLAGSITTQDDPSGNNRGHGITGSSGGTWKTATFSLAAYLDQIVFLRFAYATNGQNLGAGVWIDELGPTPVAASRRTFMSAATSLSIELAEAGRFTYRVRGIDAAGDVGRFSPIFDVTADPDLDYIGIPVAASALRSVAPNPFNPQTTIRYEVAGPRAQQVELALYDLRGRKLRQLVSASRAPGAYGLAFDGRDDSGSALASGVYVLGLRIDGDLRDQRKLTLQK